MKLRSEHMKRAKLTSAGKDGIRRRLTQFWAHLNELFTPRAKEDVGRAEERLRTMNERPPSLEADRS